MHNHITYYTQSIVCQRGLYERISSNKSLSSSPLAYAARICQGGPTFFFFGGGGGRVACREVVCDSWRSQAFVRGSGACFQKKFFLNGDCVTTSRNFYRRPKDIFVLFLLNKTNTGNRKFANGSKTVSIVL